MFQSFFLEIALEIKVYQSFKFFLDFPTLEKTLGLFQGFFQVWFLFNPILKKTLEPFRSFFQDWKFQKNVETLVQNATFSQEKTLDFQGFF